MIARGRSLRWELNIDSKRALAVDRPRRGRPPRDRSRAGVQQARSARNEADTGWANIDVQLQRRADLIPNLVEAVRGYAAHERAVFDEVTKARAALQHASAPAPQPRRTRVPARARTPVRRREAYPELQASENFLQLQEDLTDTEDKISAARRYYNSTVMHLNTAIQSVPWLLIAKPFGFRAKEFFSAGRHGAAAGVVLPGDVTSSSRSARTAFAADRRPRLRPAPARARGSRRARARLLAGRGRARRRHRLRIVRAAPLAQPWSRE